MKIKNSKSIVLFKKCLAVKQLESYANLCTIMQDFDELKESSKSQSKHIQNLIDEYLPLASKNDLSFINDENFKKDLKHFHSSVEKNITENFKDYAAVSKELSDFKIADELFSACILKSRRTGKFQVSKEKFEIFEKSMEENSNKVSKFISYFKKHSHTYLGHEHYLTATKSLSNIILSNPDALENFPVSKMTPDAFGANISTFYRNRADLSKYEEKTSGKISEALYSHTLGKNFTGKKTLIAAALALGIAGATIPSINYVHNFNSTNIEDSLKNNKDLNISDETLEKVQNARNALEDLKASNEIPTQEQLNHIRDLLDENMDYIYTDLVTKAIENEKPNWTVNSVETNYDDTGDKEKSNITVEYVDENGNTQTKIFDGSFMHKNFFKGIAQGFITPETTIGGTFDTERFLDDEYYNLVYDAFDENNNFDKKVDDINYIITKFEEAQRAQEIIGANKIVYKDGVLFDNLYVDLADNDTSPDLDDDDAR